MQPSAFAITLAALAIFAGGCATRPPLKTVPAVDVARYSGTWHEIARLPNWFQRDCAAAATAEYTPRNDGTIKVVNRCRDRSGKLNQIEGTATPVPGSRNSRLKVRFFGPFTGDYWIIGLDRDAYQWAVVGHPSRNYLWILSRSPEMRRSEYERALRIATDAGYDPARIVRAGR